jgi:hypothetical protein
MVVPDTPILHSVGSPSSSMAPDDTEATDGRPIGATIHSAQLLHPRVAWA